MAKNVDAVITGLKGASSGTVDADELRRPKPRIAFADEPRAAFPTRFQSICQHLILTLNIRTQNPDGTMRDNKFNVHFESGFVDISHKQYPFSAERVSQALQEHSGYGIGETFWNADDLIVALEKQEREAKVSAAQELAKSDEGRAALKAILGDSFQLPPAPKGE